MDKKIDKVLLKNGIKPHLVGFDYFKTAIKLCLEKNYKKCIKKGLFVDIAKFHETTPASVDRGLQYSKQKSKNKETLQEFLANLILEVKYSYKRGDK